MIRYQILLHTVQDVKNFVSLANRFPYEFDLLSGRYAVNGKSIVGIFSLDLANPLELLIYTSEPDPELLEGLKTYLVEENA